MNESRGVADDHGAVKDLIDFLTEGHWVRLLGKRIKAGPR